MSAVARETVPRVRAMQSGDLGEIIAIEHAAYSYPWSPRIFRDCLRVGYCCRVLEREGVVEGYGIMSFGVGECHILNLCVRPTRHRQGLGRMLLTRLLGLARERGMNSVFLEVRPSNQAARRLYEGMGFVQAGIRRRYYPAPDGREDALVLSRTFSRPQGTQAR
ncbi:MAG: ribosomal protein S18-alanine N-acetyltransferase [Gammaproteobacteria bacterium]|nr:ribosomal protein S18-alanine N-acetyltransferase [Gammaproteobacteria bacterium]NIR84278.1 ribosomal protein S18-alanine N-acetyltransferase [Gammaproteobacteria bacterium]NIR89748.1 ribosomal protein S18-alanine N-acetyltransferase [Gammaproteobacteria bacterium]NIU05436.1 ribosomal protein S18-alanine N-acetyltransferase [Gammaproteobacteria bacterium]NIV52382.1 ribosomal protein S18-alanine N-acetyltransferase [Gammaproteobacteria bacterium]